MVLPRLERSHLLVEALLCGLPWLALTKNPNTPDEKGVSPIDEATYKGHTEIPSQTFEIIVKI